MENIVEETSLKKEDEDEDVKMVFNCSTIYIESDDEFLGKGNANGVAECDGDDDEVKDPLREQVNVLSKHILKLEKNDIYSCSSEESEDSKLENESFNNCEDFQFVDCNEDYNQPEVGEQMNLRLNLECGPDLDETINSNAKEKPYKCNICNIFFTKCSALKNHMRRHGKHRYKCSICNSSYTRSNALKVHMGKHKGEKAHKCSFCDYATHDVSNLKVHLRMHTGEKPYKCNICSISYSYSGSLRAHMRIHGKQKPYKCNICSYSSAHSSDLNKHMRKHNGEKYKCSSCDYSCALASHFKRHMRIHSREKTYMCNFCNYSCANLSSLDAHVRKHKGDKYKCSFCNYYSYNVIKVPTRKHTGEKPYKCNICNTSFARTCSLKTHMRSHTVEKPYECRVCNYSSNNAAHLRTHMNNHFKDKPIDYIQNDFSSINSERVKDVTPTHEEDEPHPGGKPHENNLSGYSGDDSECMIQLTSSYTKKILYKCSFCDYSTYDANNFRTHIDTHPGGKSNENNFSVYFVVNSESTKHPTARHKNTKLYKCNICDYFTSWSSNIKYHVRKHTA